MTVWDAVRPASASGPRDAPHGWLITALSGAPALALVVSVVGLLVGGLSLSLNSLDPVRLELLAAIGASLALLALHARVREGVWSRELAVLLGMTALSALVLARLPEWLYGYYINGVIHRSIFTVVILLALCSWSTSTALYYALGATPSARDRARFVVLLIPIALAFVLYAAIVGRLIEKGAPELSLHAITHAYYVKLSGAPATAGMRNHILGTLLLMAMTAGIALPIGVGTGLFISEYGGALGHVVAAAVAMLRSISVFILAVTAFSLVRWSAGGSGAAHADSLVSKLIRGYYLDAHGFTHADGGSFLLAAAFLALLVIPVIARSTEEGCRSVPRDIREGSQALGATDGNELLRILLPWSLPNIITGLLLGLAEAAGSVTVLMFIAGAGDHGIGPLRGATSLAFLIFDAHPGKGPKLFTDVMSSFEFSAALLLLCITFALTIAALVLKSRFARRYRGGISFG
jgi:ABC-type phosphate transport system permease subunit